MTGTDELETRALGHGKANSGGAAPPQGRYFLFVIAVDDYTNGLRRLRTPVKDAHRIVQVLLEKYSFSKPAEDPPVLAGYEATGVLPYDTPELKCLYNDKATSTEIFKHLKFLAGPDGLKEDDSLLIYFAGHGDNVDDNAIGCLMPHKADAADEATWLKAEVLFEKFNNFKEKKKCRDLLLILDCCCAGVVGHGMKTSDNATAFSRYALASASMHQEALDGMEGSPFTIALCNLLQKNTAPSWCIEDAKLQKEFNKQLELMANRHKRLDLIQHKQQIQYQPLKECGTSEFRFLLRDPDVPPVDELSEAFIKYLNFAEQKAVLASDYEQGGEEDLIIITTVCKNFNIHKLQGKVLFEELKSLQDFNFVFAAPIIIEPDRTGNDTWTALANTLELKQEGNMQQQCATYLCNRLLKDEEAEQPLIIYLGYNFQSGDLSNLIIQFCKELQAALKEARTRVEYRQSTFNSLFLVIADTRSGENQFFRREDLVTAIGPDPKVIVSSPVRDLPKSLANKWHKDAVEKISSRNLRNLDVKQYYGTRPFCDIDAFILDISRQMGVNELELIKRLWHF